MKSRVLSELRPYLIAFVSSAVPALVFTLLVRLWLSEAAFLRVLFMLLALLCGTAALLSPLIIALVRFTRLLYAPTAPNSADQAPAPLAPVVCPYNQIGIPDTVFPVPSESPQCRQTLP